MVPTCVALLLFNGCTAKRAALNHEQLRCVLNDYNDNQIMDNIIRAYNREPLIDFEIGTVSADITSSLAGRVNGGQTSTRAAAVSVVRPFSFNLDPSVNDKLTVGVKPNNIRPEIYWNYEILADQYLKVTTCKEEVIEKAHVWKCRKEKCGSLVYYYIPDEDDAKQEYFELAMACTVANYGSRDGDSDSDDPEEIHITLVDQRGNQSGNSEANDQTPGSEGSGTSPNQPDSNSVRRITNPSPRISGRPKSVRESNQKAPFVPPTPSSSSSDELIDQLDRIRRATE